MRKNGMVLVTAVTWEQVCQAGSCVQNTISPGTVQVCSVSILYGILDARQISEARNKSTRGNCVKCVKCCEKYIQSNTNHACVNIW